MGAGASSESKGGSGQASFKGGPGTKISAHGMARLHLASTEGNLKEVHKLLSSKNVDVNEPEKRSGNVALHYAAAKGHLDVVRTLLADPRTNPNKENYHNTTPLILASGNGNVEVVEELLSHPRLDPNFEPHTHANSRGYESAHELQTSVSNVQCSSDVYR
eukprot:6837282-Pyramimonas_sp.AAC.1